MHVEHIEEAHQADLLERVGGSWRHISAGHKEIEINLRFSGASRFTLHAVYTGDESGELPTRIENIIFRPSLCVFNCR